MLGSAVTNIKNKGANTWVMPQTARHGGKEGSSKNRRSGNKIKTNHLSLGGTFGQLNITRGPELVVWQGRVRLTVSGRVRGGLFRAAGGGVYGWKAQKELLTGKGLKHLTITLNKKTKKILGILQTGDRNRCTGESNKKKRKKKNSASPTGQGIAHLIQGDKKANLLGGRGQKTKRGKNKYQWRQSKGFLPK